MSGVGTSSVLRDTEGMARRKPILRPAMTPGYHLTCSWDDEVKTYWFALTDQRNEVVHGHGLMPGESMPQLVDLIERTIGYINWEEPGNIEALRDLQKRPLEGHREKAVDLVLSLQMSGPTPVKKRRP